MILSTLAWWLLASILGWAAFPMAYRLLHRLPDRGYGVSRALGLLGAGYILWLGSSLHLLRNTLGGAAGASLIVIVSGLVVGSRNWEELHGWVGRSRRMIVVMEGLFLGAFLLWAFVRANNPDITATEKPMELAFLNAILRSESFPPADPWLSGYAISYYYFGYVVLALLTRLTGVISGVAFNLGNALWFALTALGAYSVVYNLLGAQEGRGRLGAALLGPLFLLISGNLEGFLDVLWSRQAFWRMQADGTLLSGFWRWLNIQELTRAPSRPPTWLPYRDGGFWWWRASRVVHDVDLAGRSIEVIDEFPFFSFLLADNHPHLLALPFVLAAVTLALQVVLAGRRRPARLELTGIRPLQIGRLAGLLGAGLALAVGARAGWQAAQAVPSGEILLGSVKLLVFGAAGLGVLLVLIGTQTGALRSFLGRGEFWIAAWLFGALAFLNTWDFPIFLSLLVAGLLWAGRDEPPGEMIPIILWTGVGVAAGGVLLYLPWYPTFASQASGILPNLAFPTRLPHFLVMFGTMLVPIAAWLVWRLVDGRRPGELRRIAAIAVGIPLALFVFSWLVAGAALVMLSRDPGAVNGIVDAMGAADIQSGIASVLQRRLMTSWTALGLGAILGLAIVLLRRRSDQPAQGATISPARAFVLIMVAIGALLVLAPEFVYLRDLFQDRMNTVFKFYFAAWNLWSLAAATVTAQFLTAGQGRSRVWRALVLLPLCLGLVYPLLATWTKTDGFHPYAGRTLDGTAYLATVSPEDAAAIEWMNTHLRSGVLAEAVGGSYSSYARISAHTGLPGVIGWPFHEVQWRGDASLLGSREQDILQLYQTRDWIEAQDIVQRYGIDYVYVGSLEQATYTPLVDRKFEVFMDVIYQSEGVTIYGSRQAGQP